jgi:hypothetical protein
MYERGVADGAKAAVERVKHAVLFQRTRLGTPPEKIRVTELLGILDAAASAQPVEVGLATQSHACPVCHLVHLPSDVENQR